MKFIQFIGNLKSLLDLPLPGQKAQLRMTSNRRLREMMGPIQLDKAVKSSVLLLLYPDKYNDEPNFVVILRPVYNGVHSGQIGLPGGRYEAYDQTLEHTALRESFEEIGVDPSNIEIIGKLTELFIPPSNFLVQPFIGYSVTHPSFFPQIKEVEKIIEIPLALLLDDKNVSEKEIIIGENHFTAPSFVLNGTVIWGATAMMLNEFKQILQNSSF